MPQLLFLSAILGVLALMGCAANEVRAQRPAQTATILEIFEWDTCLDAPGAQTRAQRAARMAKHQASGNTEFGEMPVAAGSPEQDRAALGGLVEGAGLGVLMGSGPDDIVVGAVAGAVGGILLATQDVEECYRYNNIRLRVDATGEILDTRVTKYRDPEVVSGKRRLDYAFTAGRQGSENFRVGDSIKVVRIVLPTSDKRVAAVPITEAECSLYPLCAQSL